MCVGVGKSVLGCVLVNIRFNRLTGGGGVFTVRGSERQKLKCLPLTEAGVEGGPEELCILTPGKKKKSRRDQHGCTLAFGHYIE